MNKAKRLSVVDDIRLPVDFLDHRKTKKMIKRLGWKALDALIRLWFYARRRRSDGILSGLTVEDIALEANWDDDADEFVEVLLEVGFLDKEEDGTLTLHEWEEHQPHAAGAEERSQRARELANLRHHGSIEGPGGGPRPTGGRRDSVQHADRMRTASESHATRNAPPPPIQPNHPPAPAPSAHAHEGAAVEEGNLVPFPVGGSQPHWTSDPGTPGEAGLGNQGVAPGPRAPLEGFGQLVSTFARLKQTTPAHLNSFALDALRDLCETVQLTPPEVVQRIALWEADLKAKGRRPNKVGHPNFFISIVNEYGGTSLPAAANGEDEFDAAMAQYVH